MQPTSFDHVALWVAGREALAGFLLEHTGMHEISRGDDFTLLGADARRGKLTLFDADGPREPGVLGRIVLRVADLEAAAAALPGARRDGETAVATAPEGLELGLVAADGGVDYDLDHVVLRVADPERTSDGLAALGFERDGDRLRVADRHLRIVRAGDAAAGGERPLLNHLALLVDSADALREEATERGLEIDRVVDAENTRAVFVRGPDTITVEYVEHKPGFALV